jgi:outer membrane protein
MKLMMKRFLPAVLLAVFMAAPAMAQTRIATIDLRKVFDNYYKRQAAEAAIKEKGVELEKEDKAYQDDYKKDSDAYTKLLADANDQSVTADEREKRKNAAELKLTDVKNDQDSIKTFESNARDTLDSQRKRMRDSILQDIKAAVEAKAKAGGFSLVVDTASETVNGTTVVLYSSGENDLTDAILAQLNAAAPAGTTSGGDDTTTPAAGK